MQLRFIMGVALILIGSFFTLLLPWVLKFIIEYFNQVHNLQLIILLAAYGMVWLISHLIVDIRQMIVYKIYERGIHNLTSEVLQKILNLSLKYHISSSTGNIINSIERAQVAIPDVLYGSIFIVLPMILELLIAVGLLGYYYGTILATILFFIFLSYVLFTWCCIPWIVAAQRQGNKSHQRVTDYITDILMNIEGIYYQSAQKPVMDECEQKIGEREQVATILVKKMNLVSIGQTIIMGVGFILMTLVAGIGVMQHQLVISDFILINGYLIQFLVPLGIVGVSILRDIREGLTKMEDVIKLLNEKEDIVDKPTAKSLSSSEAHVFFKHVSFIYPGTDHYILKDIDFNIAPGESVAIVGTNGVGKSTIAKLLYRLFDVTTGQITLQDKDIRDVRICELRKLIGIVPQETFLLNNTIYANLLFGIKGDVDPDVFNQVVQVTNVNDFVDALPERYMTIVGERGVKLSGGEKKKIGIARVLLRNPKILILDEAMSSLDVESEYQILNHINENYKNITKIIITHNAKYLYEVEKVLYLENGMIKGCGSHEKLLLQNEQYRNLWQK